MNILILGNTAGLTNDFILKTFPNQAVFIFGHTGVKNGSFLPFSTICQVYQGFK